MNIVLFFAIITQVILIWQMYTMNRNKKKSLLVIVTMVYAEPEGNSYETIIMEVINNGKEQINRKLPSNRYQTNN